MPLSIGSRLGPHEILSLLGAGGMGEVYRARDTRLERTVAVKVLPAHTAASPEARRRLEREAKTISQLSHPHICALYDAGREGDVEYLVMELLEGETLSEPVAKGPLPRDRVLRYGEQIADALDEVPAAGGPAKVLLSTKQDKTIDLMAVAVRFEANGASFGEPQRLSAAPPTQSPRTPSWSSTGRRLSPAMG